MKIIIGAAIGGFIVFIAFIGWGQCWWLCH